MAQEVHYSQPLANPVAFNPASTGLFNGNIRLHAASRLQWLTTNNAIRSVHFACDRAMFNQRQLGLGVQINQTKAGEASLAHTSIALSASYIKPLSKRNTSYFSFGLNIGIDRWAFDVSKATFDAQYNGTLFDVTASSMELPFNYTSKNFFNAGAGGLFYHSTDIDKYFFISIAVDHINSYNFSILNNSEQRLSPRLNSLLAVSINLDKNHTYSIIPAVSYIRQGAHKQSVIGASFRWVPIMQQKDKNAYVFALRSRLTPNNNLRPRSRITTNVEKLMFPESIIAEARYEQRQTFSIGLAYDANLSEFVFSNKTIGAIELSLMKIIGNAKSRQGNITCPNL
jgi:type IX secretion system PorP/SprF family membrane protein